MHAPVAYYVDEAGDGVLFGPMHAVDDPRGKKYGTYLTRHGMPPNPEQLKSRWI